MHLGIWAERTPDSLAVVMHGAGTAVTYAELEDRSSRLAQAMYARGLRPGDHIALFMENRPEFFDVVWAALRSGLYVTPVNRYLTTPEAGYIVDDCEAKVVIVSDALASEHPGLSTHAPRAHTWLVVGDGVVGYDRMADAVADHAAEPLADEPTGAFMLYSSGTTGRPKGIKPRLSGRPLRENAAAGGMLRMFGADEHSTYLSPAPLYHAAPAGFCISMHGLGGTVVVLERFDPVEALAAIERHRVTHSQWVPTMFVRMLKLPTEERDRFDLSSHRVAVHAAAPCPRDVKQQMLEWWGPIIHEYYAGTEGIGMTYASPVDWLANPGTVGRAKLGTIHICDNTGQELPVGEDGVVYFERERRVLEYHNAPDKTRSVHHPEHPTWASMGDVGHVDENGFLYLTDRATFMIVCGGVNIYPQEIEDVLVLHPAVLDVGVIGVPNDDLGEEVKAVVQLVDPSLAGPELVRVLLEFASERLARYKVPRSIDFAAELPRLPTGKLYKRALRAPYWEGRDSAIG